MDADTRRALVLVDFALALLVGAGTLWAVDNGGWSGWAVFNVAVFLGCCGLGVFNLVRYRQEQEWVREWLRDRAGGAR